MPQVHAKTESAAATGKAMERKRVTFMIRTEVDDLLELFCNYTKNQKNDVAQEALIEHLSQRRKELADAIKKSQDALQRFQPSPRRSRTQDE